MVLVHCTSCQCVVSVFEVQVDSFYSLDVMAQTKIQVKINKMKNSPKTNSSRVMVFVHCISQKCILSAYKL